MSVFTAKITCCVLTPHPSILPGAACQEPQCVVITPTRELAIQIKDEARKFSHGSMVKSVVAYGGTSVGFQLSTLVKGCNILICTPGRMLDFVDKGKVAEL